MTTIYVNKGSELPERHENDEYITENNLIAAAMKIYAPLSAPAILDIGAGNGCWGTEAAKWSGNDTITGVEIQNLPMPKEFTFWHNNTDFMDWQPRYSTHGYDFIVSNPPYYIAEKIIRKSWGMLNPKGSMLMLLRLSFQSSVGRYKGLWNEIWPMEVGVLSRRPSFYGGKTNGTDYGLFYWHKKENGDPSGNPCAWMSRLINYER